MQFSSVQFTIIARSHLEPFYTVNTVSVFKKHVIQIEDGGIRLLCFGANFSEIDMLECNRFGDYKRQTPYFRPYPIWRQRFNSVSGRVISPRVYLVLPQLSRPPPPPPLRPRHRCNSISNGWIDAELQLVCSRIRHTLAKNSYKHSEKQINIVTA